MKLWEFIKQKMYKNLSQTMCEEGASMTFEELIMFAEIFAKRISGEECCAIWCASEMATAMALLSCFAAEVTAVPLPFRYGGIFCGEIFDLVKPTAMITDTDGELKVIPLPKTEYNCPNYPPALIMCTFGTSGALKGVMLSGENIMTSLKDICAYFEIEKDDTILIARPLYHNAVLTSEFLVSLIKGTKIQFYSKEFNPYKLTKIVRTFHITVFCGTPTMLVLLSHFAQKENAKKLRIICVSGELMGKAQGNIIREQFSTAKIYRVYGVTEASSSISYLPPELFLTNADSVGITSNSVFLKIIKKSGQVAKNNEEGMLWVKGKNVMLGYYNNSKLTRKVIKENWLCTGDVACIDENGLLKIIGRNGEKDVIFK